MEVLVPETDSTGRGPCILGEENLGADHELRFRFVVPRGIWNVQNRISGGQLLDGLELRVKVWAIGNSDNT